MILLATDGDGFIVDKDPMIGKTRRFITGNRRRLRQDLKSYDRP